MSIEPTLSLPILGGEITVHAFGREHGCDFSFRGFDESKEQHKTHTPIFEALASIASEELEAFAAPSPSKMNAEIVWPGEIPCMSFSPGAEFRIYRGTDADGVTNLDASCGYAMSAADCALVVAKCGDIIVAAHAGRNSIIDMARVRGKAPRRYQSVVDSICRCAFEGQNLKDVRVWVGFSISPGPHFQHSMFDKENPHNSRLVTYVSETWGRECFKDDGHGRTLGWLDTKELIRRQFTSFGVPEQNIILDSMCTYSEMKDGEPVWYSNKRQLVAGEVQRRNLVAVVVND